MDVRDIVYVEQSNKFMDIKYKLKELKGNQNKEESIYDYEILHDGDDDNKYLMECYVCDAPFIRIADGFRTGMQIFIKTIDDKILTFEMQHSNKIRDVKIKIQQKIKLSADQQNLYFQGEILNDDDKTIGEYQICDKSVIDIVARLRGGMLIFAKLMDGKKVSFEVQNSDKIIDIKYKIQEKTGLHPDEQKLIYQDEVLENDKTINEYGITGKSVINIVAKLRGMRVFARTLDGKTVAFEVFKSDKIINVKYKIQEKTGLHPDEQELFYQCELLENDKTIDEYQICERSVIDVADRLRPGGMLIFAETKNGEIFTIYVEISDKMRDVKYKIQFETGLRSNEQILIYQDKILNDDEKTIGEYQICDKSVINIVDRLRGAMLIFARKEDGKIFSIYVGISDKIIDIKYKIQEKTGLHPNEQILIYRGEILDNEISIDDYEIFDGDVMNIVVGLRGAMNISVRTINGKIFSIYVDKSYKIRDIKYKIQCETGLHPDEQNLLYQGRILEDDDKTVGEYQIRKKYVIKIVANNQ